MKKILLFLLLLALPTVHAYTTQDPNEGAYKTYLDVEIKVMGVPVYVFNYYTDYLVDAKNGNGEPPKIVVLGEPIEAKMTVKVPDGYSFKATMNPDGITTKMFTGREVKKESGYQYLEYTLQELGEWTFVLDSPFDTDFYRFILVLPQYSTSTGSYSSRTSSTPQVDVSLSQAEFSDGDPLTFTGSDLTNPNIDVIYASVQRSITQTITFNNDYTTLKVLDTTGVKSSKTLTIIESKSFFSMDTVKKYVLPLVIIIIVVLIIKKKMDERKTLGTRTW